MKSDDYVNVSELRQWLYCPRVVWHQRILGHQRPITDSMEEGKCLEEERREKKRKCNREIAGMLPGKKIYNIYLISERLQLVGICDMVLELWEARRCCFVPIEMKATEEKLDLRHKIQLAAYGLLLREKEGECNFGYLVTLPSREANKVYFDQRLIQQVVEVRDEILKTLKKGLIPEPTQKRAKCVSCEFKRFCNDIW